MSDRALIGFGLMAGALAGFYSIKEPVTHGSATAKRGRVAASTGSAAASRSF